MHHHSKFFASLASLGAAIGKGLIAGLTGAAAMTLAQMIEMKLTGRSASSAPVKVGGDAMGVEPKGSAKAAEEKAAEGQPSEKTSQEVEASAAKFGQIMHFGYGTGWGTARGLLDLAGVRGCPATALHFGAVWGTALVMLPAAGASEPATKWPVKTILIDIVHHAVYAVAAGVIYDAMKKSG